MLKKTMLVVMPFLLLAFLIGCAQPEMSKQTTVEQKEVSAPTMTADEKAVIESLQPQVDQIFASVLGEERAKSVETAKITQEEMNQIDAQVKALLKSKFGNDIERFFVTKKLTPKKAVSENATLKNMKYNDTSDLIGSHNANNANYYYYNKITVYSILNPYYRYNVVSQSTFYHVGWYMGGYTEYYIPYFQAIAVVDDVTPYPGINNTCYGSNPTNLLWEFADGIPFVFDVHPPYDGNIYSLYARANIKKGSNLTPGNISVYCLITDANVTNGSTYYAVCFYF